MSLADFYRGQWLFQTGDGENYLDAIGLNQRPHLLEDDPKKKDRKELTKEDALLDPGSKVDIPNTPFEGIARTSHPNLGPTNNKKPIKTLRT